MRSRQTPLVIVQNITREGPGRLLEILQKNRIPFIVADLSQDEPLPDPADVGTAVVLGGPDSANDPTRKIQFELQWIQDVVEAGVPYLGICLGMQLLVKAMGGSVVRCPVPEHGWRDRHGKPYIVQITDEGARDPLFQGLSGPLPIFHLHGETVELPATMALLATGTDCFPQVVRYEPQTYGIQGHWELTMGMLEQWLQEDPDLQALDRESILRDARKFWQVYTATGDRIFVNFLKIAGWLPGGQ